MTTSFPFQARSVATYLEENAAAADIRLTPAEVRELEAAIPASEVAGDRYAAANMKNIDRST